MTAPNANKEVMSYALLHQAFPSTIKPGNHRELAYVKERIKSMHTKFAD